MGINRFMFQADTVNTVHIFIFHYKKYKIIKIIKMMKHPKYLLFFNDFYDKVDKKKMVYIDNNNKYYSDFLSILENKELT